MKKRIFAVAAALCLLAGTGAFAQDSKKAPMMKERPTAEQMAQRMTERMQKELKLTDAQAKLLLSAMMTDTLMLKSPTTTDVDRATAAKLGEQLGVDPVKFGMEVFLSRPSGSFTPEQMVGNDIKLFEVAGKQLLIGQYETVDKTRALGMIPEIREAMRAYQAQKGADGIVLCITDIMEEGSQVLLEGDTAAAQKGLKIEDVAEGVWCPGVLSRKKQVAAPILAAN